MSAKTIIGKNKGMRGSEKKVKRKKKLPSYGADRTIGLNLKFSNRVRKQNKQGMNEAKDIIKKAADQKLKGGGMIYKDMGGLVGGQTKLDMNKDGMITGQDFKMMTKKHGGKITYRMNGGQVVAGSYE